MQTFPVRCAAGLIFFTGALITAMTDRAVPTGTNAVDTATAAPGLSPARRARP